MTWCDVGLHDSLLISCHFLLSTAFLQFTEAQQNCVVFIAIQGTES